MVRSISFVAACSILAALAQPLLAQSPAPATASEAKELDPAQVIFEQLYGGKPAEALRDIDELLSKAESKQQKAILRSLRASALLGLKKDEEAAREFIAAAALDPAMPEPLSLQFMSGVVFNVPDVAGPALERLATVFPDAARDLDEELVYGYLEGDPENKSEKFNRNRIALARIGYGGAQGDYLTLTAVELLLAKGDRAEAEELVRLIDDRYVLQRALITRKYSSLWSTMEANAGPNMARIEGLSVEIAKREFMDSSNDPKKLAHLITTYRRARRYDEAIAVGADFATTPAQLTELAEHGGWAVNNHAFALFAAKRFPEADARIGALVDANKSSWIVNMAINRVEMLWQRGEFADVMRHLPVAEDQARTHGNPYAQQLVRRIKLCTLNKLGRAAEAGVLRAEVIAKSKDAPAATIEGLICVGDLDAAARVAIEALASDNRATETLIALQRLPLDEDDMAKWMQPGSVLRDRPEVAAAFDRTGRDLPRSMWSRRTEELAKKSR